MPQGKGTYGSQVGRPKKKGMTAMSAKKPTKKITKRRTTNPSSRMMMK